MPFFNTLIFTPNYSRSPYRIPQTSYTHVHGYLFRSVLSLHILQITPNNSIARVYYLIWHTITNLVHKYMTSFIANFDINSCKINRLHLRMIRIEYTTNTLQQKSPKTTQWCQKRKKKELYSIYSILIFVYFIVLFFGYSNPNFSIIIIIILYNKSMKMAKFGIQLNVMVLRHFPLFFYSSCKQI